MVLTLTDLPPEIILATLQLTDWKIILRCSAICRKLHSLVADSVLLQYLIELGSALLIDDGLTSHSVPEKLALLRDQQARWKTLNFARKDIFTLHHESSIFDLQQGYWVHCDYRLPEVPVHIHRLSPIRSESSGDDRDVMPSHMDYGYPGVAMCDLSIDPAQDLIVYVCTRETAALPERLEAVALFRTISENMIHPLAANGEQFLHHSDGWAIDSYVIQILGDLVGILMPPDDSIYRHRIAIINWKSGNVVLSMELKYSHSFTFLSEAFFLIFCVIRDRPSMHVYPIIASPTPLSPMVLFLFPPFGESFHIDSLLLQCKPSPLSQLPSSAFFTSPKALSREVERLFRISPKASVMSVSMTLTKSAAYESRHFTFIISTQSLLHEVTDIHTREGYPNSPSALSWESWGPRSSRVFSAHSATYWAYFVCGSRFILDRGNDIEVLDFNPYVVRRATAEDVVVTRRTTLDDQHVSIFDEEVVSELPYLISHLNIDKSPSYSGAMIDEGGIVLVNVDGDDQLLEVLAMDSE